MAIALIRQAVDLKNETKSGTYKVWTNIVLMKLLLDFDGVLSYVDSQVRSMKQQQPRGQLPKTKGVIFERGDAFQITHCLIQEGF